MMDLVPADPQGGLCLLMDVTVPADPLRSEAESAVEWGHAALTHRVLAASQGGTRTHRMVHSTTRSSVRHLPSLFGCFDGRPL
jgi:hypothetical protein